MEQALRTRSNIKKMRLYGRFMTESHSQSKKIREKKHQQQGDKICQESHGEAAILPEEKGSEQGQHAREEML
jgi:hypothetical protein